VKAARFPLAAVKELRETQKMAAERALAEEMQREAQAQAALQAALDLVSALADSTMAGGRFIASQRAQACVTLQFERERCDRLAELVAAAAKQVQAQRASAEVARQSFELVVKLEEKWTMERKREELRRSQNMLDEIAQSRAHRQWEEPL
jgi:flagellar biosynthesis chaperone FliJ